MHDQAAGRGGDATSCWTLVARGLARGPREPGVAVAALITPEGTETATRAQPGADCGLCMDLDAVLCGMDLAIARASRAVAPGEGWALELRTDSEALFNIISTAHFWSAPERIEAHPQAAAHVGRLEAFLARAGEIGALGGEVNMVRVGHSQRTAHDIATDELAAVELDLALARQADRVVTPLRHRLDARGKSARFFAAGVAAGIREEDARAPSGGRAARRRSGPANASYRRGVEHGRAARRRARAEAAGQEAEEAAATGPRKSSPRR